MKIIHGLRSAKPKIGQDAHSLCGLVASVEMLIDGSRYRLLGAAGNEFFGAVNPHIVTCKKCSNLITTGTINGTPSSRTADAQKRTAVA